MDVICDSEVMFEVCYVDNVKSAPPANDSRQTVEKWILNGKFYMQQDLYLTRNYGLDTFMLLREMDAMLKHYFNKLEA